MQTVTDTIAGLFQCHLGAEVTREAGAKEHKELAVVSLHDLVHEAIPSLVIQQQQLQKRCENVAASIQHLVPERLQTATKKGSTADFSTTANLCLLVSYLFVLGILFSIVSQSKTWLLIGEAWLLRQRRIEVRVVSADRARHSLKSGAEGGDACLPIKNVIPRY